MFDDSPVSRFTLTVVRTGEIYTTMRNPLGMTLANTQNLARDKTPGASHELIRWMSSEEKDITLSFPLDAEIAMRNRGRQIDNQVRPDQLLSQEVGDGLQYSLQGEIDFLRSLTYEEDPALPGADGPPRCTLIAGIAIPGILGIVANVSINIKEFSRRLAPTKADVSLTFARIVTQKIYRDAVFQSGGRL